MIHPMIGKTVWYYGATSQKPQAAVILRIDQDNPHLLDVLVFAGGEHPREATSIRFLQPGDNYKKAERVEWPPWVVEEEAFRSTIDEFADKMSAKVGELVELVERQLGTMDERLSFAVAEHGETAKLVAEQAESLITIQERLSALEPNKTPANEQGEEGAPATNAPDANAGAEDEAIEAHERGADTEASDIAATDSSTSNAGATLLQSTEDPAATQGGSR